MAVNANIGAGFDVQLQHARANEKSRLQEQGGQGG
jgi:hypothetical protein